MKIKQIIISETTTAGAVATVAKPMGETQKRPDVKGLQPVGTKTKKKGPYANSISEGKKRQKDKVEEAKLEEDDLILVPGQGRIRKTGFIKHDPDKAEHEGQTLKNSLHTIIRVATHLNQELSVRDNFPEWVSEKIGAVKSNMVTVMDYLISAKEMGHDFNEMTGGVIAGGGVGEGGFIKGPGGVPLDRHGNPKLPKVAPEKTPAQPKLTLDDVWRKIENVCSQIAPDGDPIDWLGPWLEKHGVRDFKVGEVLDRAAKKNGYKDLYDYYDEIKSYADGQGVAEGIEQMISSGHKIIANRKTPNGDFLILQNKNDGKYEIHKFVGPASITGYEFKAAYKTPEEMQSAFKRLTSVDESVVEGSTQWHPSSTVKNPNFNDELSGRRVSPPGKRLKSGGLDYNERTSQERTKALMKHTQNKGGLTGPKGALPEGANVDRMVGHIEDTYKKKGKSADTASDIAWATANKRGMLDNKNKKGK